MNADRWTVTDVNNIPTGEIRSVNNSTMDLRNPTVLGDVIEKTLEGGYDYNFCLSDYTDPVLEKFVAKVFHPRTGRTLEIFTNQPGVQFYTANNLPEIGSQGIEGKEGAVYYKYGAFCLETQNYPDAINHASIFKYKLKFV
jgi:aldose 1-epimerase